MTDAVALLGREMNHRVSSYQKRPGVLQLLAPFYHDDGDMQEVFLSAGPTADTWLLTDYGMTLMRLSYTFDNLSDGREGLIQKIADENRLRLTEGGLQIVSTQESLFFDYMAMQRAITQVMAIKFQKTRKSVSTFYDEVRSSLLESLAEWNPRVDYQPLEDRDDLVVDIEINSRRPIFIYAARDDQRYLRAGLNCSQFTQHGLSFKSLLLVDDETAISANNWKTVTNIVDKQFIGKADILTSVPAFVRREVA